MKLIDSSIERIEESSSSSCQTPKINGERMAIALSMIQDDETEVISFDIYDTLLVRHFGRPKDLFLYLENDEKIQSMLGSGNFAKLRISAEQRAREHIKRQGKLLDPTIWDIYAQLGELAGLRKDQLEVLSQLEQEAEVSFAAQRPAVKLLYDAAVGSGKRVILCSDMYLPVSTIERTLCKCGYNAHSDLFVSSAVGATKKHGTIFRHIEDVLGISAENFVHFGDNKHSDIGSAEKANWRAFKIFSVSEMMFGPSALEAGVVVPKVDSIDKIPSVAARHNYAIIANKMFGSLIGDARSETTPYDFGYASIGPFVLSLALWMRRHCSEKGIAKIHLLARDGFLPMKAMALLDGTLGKETVSSYLPISRKVLFPYFVHQPGGLEKVLAIRYRPDLTVGQFVSERFGPAGIEVLRFNTKDYDEHLSQYLMKDNHELVCDILRSNIEALKTGTQSQYEALVEYFTSKLSGDEAAAIFDVGRKGTFQSVLSKLSGKRLFGFYVVNDYDILSNAPGRSFESFLGIIDPVARKENADTIIYEAFLSERASTFVSIDSDGVPVRAATDSHSNSQSKVFEQAHAGALDYVRDALSIHGTRVKELEQEGVYASFALENWRGSSAISQILDDAMHDDPISVTGIQSVASYSNRRPSHDPRLIVPPKGARKRIMIYCPAVTRIRGGAERIAVRLANYLQGRSYEVLVFSSGHPSGSEVPVYEVSPGVIVRNVNVKDAHDVEKLVRAFSPDAALILASGPATLNVSLALLRSEVPYMMSERASPIESLNNYWKNFTAEDYFSAYDAASIISVQFGSFRTAFPENMQSKIIVLPNPIEIPETARSPRENTIICVGRIWFEQKRQDVLLEAFAKVAKEFPEWKVKFYGTSYGDNGETLRQRAQELNLRDRVEIHDSTPNISDEMKRAKITVMPSAFEGFPNALAEALALGIPAIGFKSCPGVNELIEDEANGLLVPDDDLLSILTSSRRDRAKQFANSQLSDRLSQALRRMMADESFRNSASEMAAQRIKVFEDSKVLQTWKEAVEQLLKENGSAYRRQRERTLSAIASASTSRPSVSPHPESASSDSQSYSRQFIVDILKAQRLPYATRCRFALMQLFGKSLQDIEDFMIAKALAPNGPCIVPVPDNFDELGYLGANQDVEEAVRAGQIQSGFVHYVLYGANEGRALK